MAAAKLPPTAPTPPPSPPRGSAKKVKEDPQGVVWPAGGGTTETAKAAFAAAAAGLDDAAAAAVLKEKRWRDAYHQHIVRHVEIGRPSAEHALRSARQGLEFLYTNFRFARPGAPPTSIAEAMASPQQPSPFRTAEIRGAAPAPAAPAVAVPWSLAIAPGRAQTGAELERTLDAAAARGLLEPSVPDAVRRLHADATWRGLLPSTAFVAFGAGSAMCPVRTLLDLGATVVAVDIAVPQVWRGLIEYARRSSGTLLFPVSADSAADLSDEQLASAAGCDICVSAPEVLDWLRGILPQRRMVIGSYAYADGANFPRVTLAMDAVAQGVIAARPKGSVSLAYLCSPTDVFGIPMSARKESERKRTVAGMGARSAAWQLPLKAACMGKFLLPNTAGRGDAVNGFPVVDCLVSQQGPNYILAKRLQHWRAMVARSDGVAVSTNVAPASHTVSVRKAKLLAAAYDGCANFLIEIFNPHLSRALMAAMMLHDLGYPGTVSDPSAPLGHPYELFMHGAVHGGMWRAPWLLRSVVEPAAAIQLAKEYKVPHAAAAAAAAAAALTLRARL